MTEICLKTDYRVNKAKELVQMSNQKLSKIWREGSDKFFSICILLGEMKKEHSFFSYKDKIS